MFRHLAALSALLCVLPFRATAADSPPRIYRDRVQPHWFANNTKFWYRISTGKDEYEFVLVDAEKGTRQLAFDHERLANALKQTGTKEAVAKNLSLQNLEFEDSGNSISFRAEDKTWRCDLKSYEVRELTQTTKATASGLAFADAPRASRRTGDETSLTFINRTSAEVRLFWLDSDGQRQGYGTLAPGETRNQHTFAGHVWLATDAEGKPLAVFEADEAGGDAVINGEVQKRTRPERRERRRPRSSGTSPDGHWAALLKDHNVVLTNAETSNAITLTKDGTATNGYSGTFYWSPDSKKLVAMRTLKGDDRKVYLIESSPKDQLQPKLDSYEYLKPGDRVAITKPHLFDVEKACEIPIDDALFQNPWSLEDVRWAPDSSRFTFVYNQRGHQVLRIVAVDSATGKAKPIVDEQSQTFIAYSGKYFCEYLDAPEAEIIWMSERDGWNHLYLYDAVSGRVKNQITKGPWVVRGVEHVDREKRQIWFRAGGIREGQDPYYVHYCRVNFDGSGLVILTERDGTHTVQYSPDRRFAIDACSRVDSAPVNELRCAEDGKLVCILEESDTHELKAANWRPPEQFVAKGRDGVTDIYGILHWPKDFDPQKRYPVIESIYAGPQDSFVPTSFRVSYGSERLCSRGFIVVQIDGMGTSNRSKKFHDVCWKNLGDSGFPDRILWMKAAAAKYPCMDLSRVGIYGTSAGGQSALRALLAHGDFYKAAVSDSGCHDNRMDKIWWNEQWMGWPVGPHYEEQSNVTQAHNLQGKLLLMFGELDRNVDPASSMQVVNALIKADKDFELLVVPGAGHGVLGRLYCQRRMLNFFERSLLGN